MPVYVDDMRAGFGRMVMCHMVADTLDELHAMADKIGVARRWYQGPPAGRWPHYDIALSKRALAVRAGAQEIKQREAPAIARRCLAGQAPDGSSEAKGKTMRLNYRETDGECPNCGATAADRKNNRPNDLQGLAECPHCGAEKCSLCDLGDDVECGSCDSGDED